MSLNASNDQVITAVEHSAERLQQNSLAFGSTNVASELTSIHQYASGPK